MKKFYLFFWLLLSVFSIKTVESTCYLALDTGYRWDRTSNRATFGGRNVSVKGSTQELKDINSYQLGVKGCWNFYEGSYLRGEGHYGWTGNGNYSEGGYTGHTKGHTFDGKGAVGYAFCVAPSILFAPVVGYSYDGLHLKAHGIRVAINGINYHKNPIKAHQSFRGAFLGFDAIFDVCGCLDFIFTYEFHFAKWNGERLIQGGEYGNSPIFGTTTAWSNVRNLNNVYGNFFSFDLGYQICGWRLGLDLKFQSYYGRAGHYKQTRGIVNELYTYHKVDGLRWLSFASTITLGKAF